MSNQQTLKNKFEFLKKVQPIEKDKWQEYVKDQFARPFGQFSYDQTTAHGAHNKGYCEPGELNDLLRKIYESYYHMMVKRFTSNSYLEAYAKNVEDFLQHEEWKPEYLKKFPNVNYENLMEEITDYYNGKIDLPEMQLGSHSNFYHIHFLRHHEDISLRLYLNIENKYIPSMVKALWNKCVKQHPSFYFKFSNTDIRNDTFIIYTNYDNAQKMVDIIEEIKDEQPEMFETCTVENPNMGSINGYIGVGEEPVYKHSSFNLERSELYREAYHEVYRNCIKEIIQYQPTTVVNSLGQELNSEQYLDYLIHKHYLSGFQIPDTQKNDLVVKIKREIKDQLFNRKKAASVTCWVQNKKYIIDLTTFNFEEKLCAVFGVPYQNGKLSSTAALVESMYLQNVDHKGLRLVTEELKENYIRSLKLELLRLDTNPQLCQFCDLVIRTLEQDGGGCQSIMKLLVAEMIDKTYQGKNMSSFFLQPKFARENISNMSQNLQVSIAPIYKVFDKMNIDYVNAFQKKVFTNNQHDVAQKGSLSFLNQSSLIELKQAGFDISKIGSEAFKNQTTDDGSSPM